MELCSTQWNTARELLESGQYTCVVCRENQVFTAVERGVKPLVRWVCEGTNLREGWAADRVVGRATAFLYCLLGVKGVYAQVMSHAAAQALQAGGIAIAQGKLVDNIINRQGTGICPFEAAVLDIQDSEEAYRAILAKMEQLGIPL